MPTVKKTTRLPKKTAAKAPAKPEAVKPAPVAAGKPIFDGKYINAIGRRKTAVAQVRLYPEAKTPVFLINGEPAEQFFPKGEFLNIINAPLVKASLTGAAVSCRVAGGGPRGQAEAIRLGVSRAIVGFNEDFKKELKDLGYLTRDPRMKERKKYGLKKARRAAQWSKR